MYPPDPDPPCRIRLVTEGVVVLPVMVIGVEEFVLVQVAKYCNIGIPPELIDGGVKYNWILAAPLLLDIDKLIKVGAGTLQAVAVEPGTHGGGGT
jgi:hypothetical protein